MNPALSKRRASGWLWPGALILMIAPLPFLITHLSERMLGIAVFKTQAILLRQGIAGANIETAQIDKLLQNLIVLARTDPTAAAIVDQFGITNTPPPAAEK